MASIFDTVTTPDDRRYVSYDEALAALTAAVEERGRGYVYEPPKPDFCSYAEEKDGTLVPSCGVGNMLFRLDPEWLPIAHRFDPFVDGRAAGMSASVLLNGKFGETAVFDPRAIALAIAFQNSQDAGETWGASLAYAIAHANR